MAMGPPVCYHRPAKRPRWSPPPRTHERPPRPLRTAPGAEGRLVAPAPAPAAPLPSHIGRYRVERLLGEGGFGRVYLARDEQLQRLVAVKVPHRHLLASPQDADAYLAEARTAAGLEHPGIVPVFDVGSTSDLACFIVSKFIEGRTLAWTIRTAACRAEVGWRTAGARG